MWVVVFKVVYVIFFFLSLVNFFLIVLFVFIVLNLVCSDVVLFDFVRLYVLICVFR